MSEAPDRTIAPVAGRQDAPAKVNLALHVTGRRADGYHLLDSLVCFTEDGDGLDVAVAVAEDRLLVRGPFAQDVPSGPENILLRALGTARRQFADRGHVVPPLSLTLDKRLPVAAGIGGGSADAAALLRMLAGIAPDSGAALRRAAVGLGADVPMCLDGRPCRVTGIGEVLEPLAGFPDVAMVLVNPGVPVATPDVFRALASRHNPPLPDLPHQGFADVGALVAWLGLTRNDLEPPALRLAPVIEAACRALRDEGALFTRMSGSGATIFGLFDDVRRAELAGRALAGRHPKWWVKATRSRRQRTDASR